jgi:hypothetical protein
MIVDPPATARGTDPVQPQNELREYLPLYAVGTSTTYLAVRYD